MNGYALNTELAKEGSGRVGGRIQASGKYLGVIEWAREVTFASGAVCIEVKFVSTDDENAIIKLWPNSKDPGKVSFGMKQLMALMTCVKVKRIQQTQGTVEVWSKEANGMANEPATVFPELANKPVGLLLEKENDVYNDKPIFNMILKAPFTADTSQTAKELLDGKGAIGSVEKLENTLKDRFKGNVTPIDQGQGAQGFQHPAETMTDDDIPF